VLQTLEHEWPVVKNQSSVHVVDKYCWSSRRHPVL